MLIGLKGNNYYSKVFKRVNYKLSNSPFWVVITKVAPKISHRVHLMKEELDALKGNNTWVLIPLPLNVNYTIGSKWGFYIKLKEDSNTNNF